MRTFAEIADDMPEEPITSTDTELGDWLIGQGLLESPINDKARITFYGALLVSQLLPYLTMSRYFYAALTQASRVIEKLSSDNSGSN